MRERVAVHEASALAAKGQKVGGLTLVAEALSGWDANGLKTLASAIASNPGTAVVLVEQSVNVALSIADHAYFMEKGEVRFSGPTSELLERSDLLRSVFLEGAGAR